ncbi:MAG TPA: hypothetical protein VFZ78_12515 [Flavisolibacter sp.]
MKKIIMAACLTGITTFATAQHFGGVKLQYLAGMGVQENKFEAVGISLHYEGFQFHPNLGLLISAERNFSGFDSKRINVGSGSTNVDYSSTLNQLMVGGVYVPFNGRAVSPYVSVKGGVMFYSTSLHINDPWGQDVCQPEQSNIVKLSAGAAGNAEAGLKLRLTNKARKEMFLQAGVGYTLGTRAKYVRLDDSVTDESASAYTSKFRAPDGSTHEHRIGTLYRTSTSQLIYSLGLTFRVL